MSDRGLEIQQQTLRLPLYAHEEQRASNSQFVSATQASYDQVLINCFPVIAKDPLQNDKPIVKIQQRMGWGDFEDTVSLSGVLTSVVDTVNTYPVAILNFSQLDDVIVIVYVEQVAADHFWRIVQYRPTANTCLLIGSIQINSAYDVRDYIHISELNINAVPTLGVIVSEDSAGGDSAGYYATTSSGLFTGASLTEITDTEFPPKATFARKVVGPFVQLNNVVYVMTEKGYIHGSVADSISSWVATGVVAATTHPDRGLGLARYKHHLVAFGEETIEFFNDEGVAAPALPIERTEQAFIKIGTITQKAFLNVDDVLWFIGKSYTGQVTLYKLDGYTPVPIGQPPLQHHLAHSVEFCDLQVTTMYGVRHLITNLRTYNSVTWFNDGVLTGDAVFNESLIGNIIYCIDSNAWWIWSSEELLTGIDGYQKLFTTTTYKDGIVTRILAHDTQNDGNTSYDLHLQLALPNNEDAVEGMYDAYRVGDSASAQFFRIPVFIGTNVYDFDNNNRKFIRKASVIGDYIRDYTTGLPFTTFNAEGLNMHFGVDKSDDDVATFAGIKRSRALRTHTLHRYPFANLGSGRQFRFLILLSSYVPVRLDSLELLIAQGTH